MPVSRLSESRGWPGAPTSRWGDSDVAGDVELVAGMPTDRWSISFGRASAAPVRAGHLALPLGCFWALPPRGGLDDRGVDEPFHRGAVIGVDLAAAKRGFQPSGGGERKRGQLGVQRGRRLYKPCSAGGATGRELMCDAAFKYCQGSG